MREKEKADNKAKQEELASIKNKYDEERKEKEALQHKLDNLSQSESDVGQRLFRATEITEILRTDNKKKNEKLEKYQKDVTHMEDRIRNLEIRASEVEKAELTLDSTRRALEASQTDCRAKEAQIRRMTKDYDDKSLQCEKADDRIKLLEDKIHDLKLQVRQELVKNEEIEKKLDSVPVMRLDLEDRTKLLHRTQKELDEKAALLSAARKTIREYKDRIREMEQKKDRADVLEDELIVATGEVNTLKKLMIGKDHLVFQKSQALDMAKVILETLNSDNGKELNENLHDLVERLGGGQGQNEKILSKSQSFDSSQRYSNLNGDNDNTSRAYSSSKHQPLLQRQIDVKEYPSHRDQKPENKASFLERVVDRDRNPRVSRSSTETNDSNVHPKTAVVHPFVQKGAFHRTDAKRSVKYHQHSVDNSDIYGKYKSDKVRGFPHAPSLDYTIGIHENETSDSSPRTKSSNSSNPMRRTHSQCSLASVSTINDFSELFQKLPTDYEEIVLNIAPKQKEIILENLINIGDRVFYSVPQKPPKYGRKKVLKPIIYSGIVKYKGDLEKEYFDPKMYVGLRLDDPIGDTDGTYKGKPFMYTPTTYGKFFRLRDVDHIFDVHTGEYRKAKECIAAYHISKKGQH